jgi:hypothetical protein
MSWRRFFSLIIFSFFLAGTVRALDISLPTANDPLLRRGADADYFQPTVKGTVESVRFGCVRSHGDRFHEGIDIKCLQRDRGTSRRIRFTPLPMARLRSSIPSPVFQIMAGTSFSVIRGTGWRSAHRAARR